MRVTGKNRSDELFHARYPDANSTPDFSFVDANVEYVVYGLMIHKEGLDYLICTDNGGPYWLPSEIFGISDAKLPNWRICLTQSRPSYDELFKQLGVVALFGYSQLVEDFSHYCGIFEREDADLKLFFTEKAAMDVQAGNDSR